MTRAVIESAPAGQRQVMICKLASPPHAGKWTFPGGPVSDGETPEAALRRLLQERLGLKVKILYGQPPFDAEWEGTTHRWRFYFCEGLAGPLNNRHYQEVRWVLRPTLQEYEFDPVSQKVVDWLLEN